MSYDAERTISICRQRNLRPFSQSVPHIGEAVRAAFDGQWGDGWGLIGFLPSNAVVEKEGIIRKVPLVRVRKAVEAIIDLPAQTPNSDDTRPEAEASSSAAGRVG